MLYCLGPFPKSQTNSHPNAKFQVHFAVEDTNIVGNTI